MDAGGHQISGIVKFVKGWDIYGILQPIFVQNIIPIKTIFQIMVFNDWIYIEVKLQIVTETFEIEFMSSSETICTYIRW